jgi:hypothetical protein
MASIVLTNSVGNPFATNPETLNLSLTSKGVVVETLGTNVRFVCFNDAPVALTTNYQVISATDGTKLRVDTAYKNVQFGIIYNDGRSNIFTAVTGTTGAANRANYVPQTTTNNDYFTVYPEFARLWNLNG